MLRCETCNRKIQELTEEEAMNDLEGHGWTNWKTAHHIKCFDCVNQYDEYETYYAGRIKKGYPNRVYRMAPDLKNLEKEVECYHEI